MDSSRFDDITRSLGQITPRRSLVTGALGAAAGWLGVATVGAKPKRRKKPRRPKPAKPNAYGCLDVQDPCRRHTQCCSGICTGQPGRKRCRAHNTGGCTSQFDVCSGLAIGCGDIGYCFRTTGSASFCGREDASCGVSCKRDAECQVAHGAGAACVVCDNCLGGGSATACVPAA